MVLTNITSKNILTKDLKMVKSIKDKLLGLLLRENPRSLLLQTRFGIHTFFLKEPIDVIVLAQDKTVVKTGTVPPNSIFIYKPKFSSVIELPEGTIIRSRTQIGDRLEIKPNL